MRFANSFLDEIRDRVLISDVIGRRVTWDRKKTNVARGDYWACCPFHGEKSPSFHCKNRKGRYHCFGCGVFGDHFRFLTDLESMSFPEAVRQIADMAGVAMPQPDTQAERRERQRASLQDVMEMAAAFFEERLQAAAAARARAYLRERGLSGRTVETFRLGYAPDSRNGLKEHLAAKGVGREQMEACGLVVHENVPVSYDRFRDRIMFPILSVREKVIAFGGRALSADALAKYLNSSETELFRKGEVLYNLARARRAIQPAGGGALPVVVVEGYMDVIALHQAGIDNAVAPLGTALTENQLDLLWKMAPQPVLCFDGDGAGLRAANRVVELALPHIRPDRSVGFALLPDGKDPDDLVRHEGRDPFDRVLAQVKPLAAMIWDRETAVGNFDTPEKRAQLESRLRQIVASIGDESVRRFYQQHMRERLHAFFQPQFQRADALARAFRRDAGDNGPQRRGLGRGSETAAGISDRLSRSGLVQGYRTTPGLRESVLALTVVNHPRLLLEDYDEIAAIDYDNADLQRLWPRLLIHAAESLAAVVRQELDRPEANRQELAARLEAEGFAALLAAMDRQVCNARLWTATGEAAFEDARQGYAQALSLHQRSKALRWQKIELEREIAEAIEEGDADNLERRMRALAEVQLEIARMENQEAIVDGFGVMSGRIKGAALGQSG